ncbi:glutamate-1-semialdehyde 2,1-aminomutase [Candidatus Rhodoluna planktonica]|uniref:Glutamate-1-semialdehyde 2,1-aminomutase n=1 Tax=Candidatus Rhodoluna planktonica TaxID=535712 RepID=A0A1D9E0L6_9MICO|nr:glutamate-1-semialdehyde 2,1-aminomutase [Candidatus Rhodoluna planktonica]AOY56591.1 glutamate-1-semialdehyde aminotransferase [Candidatus Rhodoluna planktonica]
MSNTLGSEQWHERAKKLIPGGVSSPVRAFTSVGGTPRYYVRGEGSKIWDIDGNEYVDLVNSWGPMILGHAHPQVVSKVSQAVENSFSFGAPGPGEVLLAEEISLRVPACERVRFVSSGTEAVMTAVRLARAATHRNLIVKFAGCYHGHSDALLVQAGSGIATLGLPNSPGVTAGQAQDTVVLEYNNALQLEELFTERGEQIAAVITEPTPANMGVVPPEQGFNKLIADTAHKYGALMILDEVMTGFRVSKGGWWGKFAATEDWTPDIFTFGKVIGGGMPLAALGGSAKIMELLAPTGSVYQAGTLSGNPVATAAGLATLELCDESLYDTLDLRARQVGEGISDALTRAGVGHSYQTGGNLFSFFFTPNRVRNFSEAQLQNTEVFAKFFHSLLDQGVSVPPSAYEAWFVSGAITDLDVERIIEAAAIAAKVAAS